MKFDFDNRYGVYLHDTPSRGAFAKQGRMVSHGCVRLEKPQDLAQQLLDGDGAWNAELITTTIDAADTKRVALSKPISVLLFYWTAFAGTHTVQAWVDDVNRIAESNENNNKTTAPITVP